jgi:hypothetical protein
MNFFRSYVVTPTRNDLFWHIPGKPAFFPLRKPIFKFAFIYHGLQAMKFRFNYLQNE